MRPILLPCLAILCFSMWVGGCASTRQVVEETRLIEVTRVVREKATAAPEPNVVVTRLTVPIRLPVYEIEATILSLNIDNDPDCDNVCRAGEYPLDTAVVQINKIISFSNPDAQPDPGLTVGDEVKVAFAYSAQPAYIIIEPMMTPTPNPNAASGPETAVTHIPLFARVVPREKGYFIYHRLTAPDSPSGEQFLVGLSNGDEIRGEAVVDGLYTHLGQGADLEMSLYQVIHHSD